MFYRLGETAVTIDGLAGPDDLSRDVQDLEEILDRFLDVALSNERHTPIIESFGKVGSETKRLLEMFDRSGVISLTIERLARVVMREGIVRADAHGSLKMFDRLAKPALTVELNAQVVLRDDSVGFHGQDMGPQPLRVMPDVELVPREDAARAGDTHGDTCKRPPPRSPTGEDASPGQKRPSEAGQIGVSIGGDLPTILNDPQHRQQDRHVRQPRRRNARPSTAERASARPGEAN